MSMSGVPQATWLIGIGVILPGAQLGLAGFAGYVTPIEFFPIVLILICVTIVLPSHLGGEHAHQPATS